MIPKSFTKAMTWIRGNRLWPVAALLCCALVAGACCGGAETRSDTFQVGESPALIVVSEHGNIRLAVGDYGTIQVQATLRNPTRVQYQAQQEGDTVRVTAQVTGGFAMSAGCDLVITVPAATDVELTTENGSIEVSGLAATADLATSNGKIVLREVSGTLIGHTSNGAIEVTDLDGSANLKTSNGAITVKDARGSFGLETSNGSISFDGEMTAEGENRLETSNGSVTVKLQGTPSVELDATTANGQVTCALPIVASLSEEDHLVGTVGAGEAQLVIITTNGSITME
ncbi:MAG: DUF4097 family beta strand repeat-containing protein [Chloroflexota bacterium]|nr:DUF4097 family beta strand repeat-containing protein [Chloroflexota bacterium]